MREAELVKPTTACVAVCEVIEQLRTTCWPWPPNNLPESRLAVLGDRVDLKSGPQWKLRSFPSVALR